MFEKKPPRRDRNIRTPFREKAKDHSRERVTGADLWWNWYGQGCASCGFPCWNRGCERSDAILGARVAHVGRWKTTVHSTADTNHDYAPAGSKHPHER